MPAININAACYALLLFLGDIEIRALPIKKRETYKTIFSIAGWYIFYDEAKDKSQKNFNYCKLKY